MVVLGVVLLGWIGYNLFVEMQPTAEGLSPIAPTIFALALIVGGVLRLRNQVRRASRRGQHDVPNTQKAPRLQERNRSRQVDAAALSS